MADDQRRQTSAGGGRSRRGASADAAATRRPPMRAGASRPRLNKLRLGARRSAGLRSWPLVSTVFGMMMAVAQDLPELESQNEFKAARNSVLLDDARQAPLAVLTGHENRILVRSEPDLLEREAGRDRDRGPALLPAQGRRLQGHRARALGGRAPPARRPGRLHDHAAVREERARRADRTARSSRSCREAALAYQLERKWTKEKILTEYLNTVYFGEGAYGIESAARVYFGWNHPGCEPHCAAVLEPAEAALLAGHDRLARRVQPGRRTRPPRSQRRNLVLQTGCANQGLLTPSEYATPCAQALPPRNRDRSRRRRSARRRTSPRGSRTSSCDRYGTGNTFGGGLKIRTTLDLDFQKAAEQAIAGRLAGVGPSAALVAIDNDTGGVRAMVGRRGLPGAAVQPRHPGPPPAGLGVQAVHPGRGAREGHLARPHLRLGAEDARGAARRLQGRELRGPLRRRRPPWPARRPSSDNSVYAEVGYKLVGTPRSREVAQARWACARRSRSNPAMVLGGLKSGVTPLEMAQSYETLAAAGQARHGIARRLRRRAGRLHQGRRARASTTRTTSKRKRVVPEGVAEQATQILQTVVTSAAPAGAAQIGEFAAGKTGTTENYQDAWFVGFNDDADGRRLGRLSGRRAGRWRPSTAASPSRAAPTRPRSGTTSCCRSARSRDARAEPDDETTSRPRRIPAPIQTLPPADDQEPDERRRSEAQARPPGRARHGRRDRHAGDARRSRLRPSPRRRPSRPPIRPAEAGRAAGPGRRRAEMRTVRTGGEP